MFGSEASRLNFSHNFSPKDAGGVFRPLTRILGPGACPQEALSCCCCGRVSPTPPPQLHTAWALWGLLTAPWWCPGAGENFHANVCYLVEWGGGGQQDGRCRWVSAGRPLQPRPSPASPASLPRELPPALQSEPWSVLVLLTWQGTPARPLCQTGLKVMSLDNFGFKIASCVGEAPLTLAFLDVSIFRSVPRMLV